MKKVTRIFSVLTALTCLLVSSPNIAAQDYDDDLYYSPSKAKKEEAKRLKAAAEKQKQLQASRTYDYGQPTDYAGSDSYNVSSSKPLEIDVDTYNRRGSYSPENATQSEVETDEFANTRRIERFHNSDIVVESGDTDLMQYYYSQPSPQDVNIYVINSINPWDNWAWNYRPSWRWRFGSPYWSFGWGYDPWFDWSWGYDPFWGPSWGWNWGWSWGAPSWGWGCGWHPGWGPVAPPPGGGGHWGYNRPGANRPHAPSYGNGMGGSRPHSPSYGNATRPGGSSRPGNMGRPSYGQQGSAPAGVRPSQGNQGNHNGNYAPSNNSRRGRNNNNNSNATRQNSNRNNNNNSYNNSNRNYNNGSSFSRPGNSGRSGGSFGGGGSCGGGGGGGASRGRGR